MEAKHTATPFEVCSDIGGYAVVGTKGEVIVRGVSEDDAEAIAHAFNSLGEMAKAATAVLSHRVGEMPTQGWLRDNDASRKALAHLSSALSKAGA